MRRIILVHSQQVPLIKHLNLNIFELRRCDFPLEELPQSAEAKLSIANGILASVFALFVHGTVDVKIIVCIAVMTVVDD